MTTTIATKANIQPELAENWLAATIAQIHNTYVSMYEITYIFNVSVKAEMQIHKQDMHNPQQDMRVYAKQPNLRKCTKGFSMQWFNCGVSAIRCQKQS